MYYIIYFMIGLLTAIVAIKNDYNAFVSNTNIVNIGTIIAVIILWPLLWFMAITYKLIKGK